MMHILSIGECMVEMAPAEDGRFIRSFAGDTFNTAWYLRRLLPPEAGVSYFTALGSDAISDGMLGFMAGAGIGTEHVLRRADRTVGLYMISLQDGERRFSYWRETSAARTLVEDPADLAQALGGVTLAYVSGITLAILPEQGRGALLSALTAFRASGGRVAFDPNLRPQLWPDAGAMCDWVTRMAGQADVALPSFEDEVRWFGDPSPEATCVRYATAGAATVVAKNGAGPIHFTSGTEAGVHTPQPAPVVVDTTAAGDSFNAGFLARYAQGAPAAEAVRAGAELAAKVVGGRGALVEAAL